MKFGLTLKFWARVFVDAASVGTKLDQAKTLAEKIGKPVLAPQAILEKRNDGGTAQRIMLKNDEDGWSLVLLSDAFDLTRQPTSETQGANMGQLESFAKDAARILSCTIDHYGRDAHRLALIQEGLLPQMGSAEMEAVRKKLMRAPEEYPGESFEWDWRTGHHGTMLVGGNQETTNVIAHVRRAQVTLGTPTEQKEFDAMYAQLDVNTGPTNARARFKPADIEEFYMQAVDEHMRLSAAISRLLGVT